MYQNYFYNIMDRNYFLNQY